MDNDAVLTCLGYTVQNTIGQGSYGKVKLAFSKKHSGKVAIKIMDRCTMTKWSVNNVLPRELAVLKRIKHPHIVQVHEIIETRRGKVYIVMEAAKTNLSDKIYTVGHVSFDRAKQWFSQLLSAMVYLHQQDIAHRDLKSENVLLTADNRIKLADFGLAFVGEGFPNMTNTYCGTLQYTAPEVILGLPYDPMKSDVWSLGVILYEMVTGDLPFDTTNVRKLLELQHEPLPRVNLLCLRGGQSCYDLLCKMLQVNPQDRASMTEVTQHDWLLSWQERYQRIFRWQGLQGPPTIPPVSVDQDDSAGSSRVMESSSSGETPTPATPSPATPTEEEPEPEEDRSRAGADPTDRMDEVEGEEFSSSGCCPPLRTAMRRVLGPILRASRSLRKKMRNVFRFKPERRNSSSSSKQGVAGTAASTEAAPARATCGHARHVDEVSDIPLQGPTVEQEVKRPWFPRFKA
ncbi:testis-specific serine/threonine-protein kinase 6 [Astyanax mexicanus]|uniref:testis-specific serine/threonine-protein kinase 6 n=1 Tax=Astyanax mexicanus TaxID=7994 RepID=UPI0020CB2161|nr:testis-specific serine/threonine-protein kinase 6 [Astyanax mexicanus]